MSSATCDYKSFFKFTGSSDEYIISNVATSNYALLSVVGWTASLTIATTDSNSASEFEITYSSSNFVISMDRGWRTYYWNLDSNSDNVDVVTSITSSANSTAWKIYKVTANDEGIADTPQ